MSGMCREESGLNSEHVSFPAGCMDVKFTSGKTFTQLQANAL